MMTEHDPIPDGEYLVTVDDCRRRDTAGGHLAWSLRLVVFDGPYSGRFAAWDTLVFSPRGKNRARSVLRELGAYASLETLEFPPVGILGRCARVSIRRAQYVGPEGHTIERCEVPYDGWKNVLAGAWDRAGRQAEAEGGAK
jgi:hypothetical protein